MPNCTSSRTHARAPRCPHVAVRRSRSRGAAVALLAAATAAAQPPAPAAPSGGAEAQTGAAWPALDLNASAAVLDDPVASALPAPALRALSSSGRRATRGVAASQIYRDLSPAVVLVAVKGGIGSGSLLDADGHIVTNWHVVRDHGEAGIVFKPREDGARIGPADLLRARVVRIDEVADLALLRVERVPADVRPIALGHPTDVQVGADVHAIGHPAGQQWTYTRGVVSQRRPGFEWTDATGKQHVANVVQTQTPINPGNSGGPLISDEGRLIGVNTFKSSGNENLNFAISVDEVRRFLDASRDRLAATAPPRPAPGAASGAGAPCGGTREIARGVSPDGQYRFIRFDAGCQGRANLEVRMPSDATQPMTARFDRNGDGKTDILVFSPTRDGRWLQSLHDNDYDGQWDLVGHHADGQIVASRFESYAVWAAPREGRLQSAP